VAEAEKRWVQWSPDWAPHVLGQYEADREVGPSGMPDPQQVRAVCGECKKKCRCPRRQVCSCGAEWRGSCSTGAVRSHISRFAAVHLHRNPLTEGPPNRGQQIALPPPVVVPGRGRG
jgi:hypothetical protein